MLAGDGMAAGERDRAISGPLAARAAPDAHVQSQRRAVHPQRGVVVLGMLPWTSEPVKNSTSPGSIRTGSIRCPGGIGTLTSVKLNAVSALAVHRIGQRWLPGTTSMQQFASSAGSSAIQAATQVPGSARR